MAKWQSLWVNAALATMAGKGAYGALSDGALAVEDGKIAWLGSMADLPGAPDELAVEVRDCGGQWITPGLIDCHTHLVFGGNRVKEFELRLEGASYEEIAKAGGGIRSTVSATRAESDDELFESGRERLERELARPVSLPEMRETAGLEEMVLLRRGRLSVQPVTPDEWKIIVALGKRKR